MIAIEIIVSEEVEGLLTVDKSRLHEYTKYVCESSGFHNVKVNIVFIGDERMTTLNETYKK